MTSLNHEKLEILDMLDRRRIFLLKTVEGLTDQQASLTPTASSLSLAGLIKHVAANEVGWVDFMRHGPAAMQEQNWEAVDWEAIRTGTAETPRWLAEHQRQWSLSAGETLQDVVATLNETAANTRIVVSDLDLNHRNPLPDAPWFDRGESWSNRQVLLHLIGETAQHAGHADIIRETIDGRKTMG